MADMLVKLYELPDLQPVINALIPLNVSIRPARIGEDYEISPWISRHFPAGWSRGIQYAIGRNPTSIFIAVEKQPADPNRENPYDQPNEQLVGFACYDVSNRGVFGPIGVIPSHEHRGIGRALLLTALHAMWSENYAYAIIGWAGPVEWYERVVNAQLILNSEPGPFRGELKGL
jgi:GNAT superfamily N-acetyltransferase